jgi:very-short-patch-repair endonuclease
MEQLTDGYRPTTQYEKAEKMYRAKELRNNQTQAERILWSRLRANKLRGFHFRRQHPLYGYIVDFYCHQAKLIIEVDGSVHDAQQQYDKERTTQLESLGLRIVRFTNNEVEHGLRGVMLKIANLLS